MSAAQKHKSSGHFQDFYFAAKRIEAYSTAETGITTEFFTTLSHFDVPTKKCDNFLLLIKMKHRDWQRFLFSKLWCTQFSFHPEVPC